MIGPLNLYNKRLQLNRPELGNQGRLLEPVERHVWHQQLKGTPFCMSGHVIGLHTYVTVEGDYTVACTISLHATCTRAVTFQICLLVAPHRSRQPGEHDCKMDRLRSMLHNLPLQYSHTYDETLSFSGLIMRTPVSGSHHCLACSMSKTCQCWPRCCPFQRMQKQHAMAARAARLRPYSSLWYVHDMSWGTHRQSSELAWP